MLAQVLRWVRDPREHEEIPAAPQKLLDLPYAPEAEQYLDELEAQRPVPRRPRSGGRRCEAGDAAAGNDYALGPRLRQRRRSRTGGPSGRVALARRSGHWSRRRRRWRAINDSLVMRTQDGLDRAGARGLSRPDSRRLDAAHHLQRRPASGSAPDRCCADRQLAHRSRLPARTTRSRRR